MIPKPITESTEPVVRPYIPRRTGGPYIKRKKVTIDSIEEEITEEIDISTSTDEIRIPYRKIKKKVKIPIRLFHLRYKRHQPFASQEKSIKQ